MPLATALALAAEGGTDPAGSMWPVAIGLDGRPEHGLHWDAGDLRGTPAQVRKTPSWPRSRANFSLF